MSLTKREWLRDLAATTAIALTVGLIVGFLGPFGSYSRWALPERLGYWVAVIGINWLLCAITLPHVDRLFRADRTYAIVAVPLVASAVLTIPGTGVVLLIEFLIDPAAIVHATISNILALFGMVFVLFVAISTPGHIMRCLIRQRRESRKEPPVPSAPTRIIDGRALFFGRFDPPILGAITSIESQDHYLVVRGAKDHRMIHCRLSDAERELGALGLRVHRSWWVANDAIKRHQRRNGRHYLELTDGQLVPVSRSYLSALKAPKCV